MTTTISLNDLTLAQDAYVSDNWLTYEASATDKDGNDYTVYWTITGDRNDPDESNMCDWDKPYSIEKL
jgi:hypothetical protein